MRLRFYAEEGAGSCLWAADEDPVETEARLPIPMDLRRRMRAWITEFNQRTQQREPGPWTGELREDFDRRGLLLSGELQGVLGPGYAVKYEFGTEAVREWAARLAPPGDGSADDRPMVGTHSGGATSLNPARLVELLRAVAVLAQDVEAQRDWLAIRGGPMTADGLVVDLYETAPFADAFREAGWLGKRAAEQMRELVRVVHGLSGPENAGLWAAESLASAPEWNRVRALAQSVLAEL